MHQKISGYHLDAESHWVAELACGHAQHVRHDPPWMVREWVTMEEGRAGRVGTELNCVRCDEIANAVEKRLASDVKKEFLRLYEEAGVSGLCEEGRLEVALGCLESLPFKAMIEDVLRADPREGIKI